MKLLKSTATVGSATILSRILGFIRDVVLAKMFGASGETDAFFLAFRIPNFMRRLFAEGSFPSRLYRFYRSIALQVTGRRCVI